MDKLEKLTMKMIEFNNGDPMRIQHFIKVHSFARLIGRGENIPEDTLYILQAAALVHDIGIRPAERKFGKSNGKLQEQEGPEYARQMMQEIGFDSDVIDRVCFLVGHHHTYDNIDGIDYRILVEADFLVNIYEDKLDGDVAMAALNNIFKTDTGKQIFNMMFLMR